ncbi:MAG: hypothetical protein JSV53_06980, partial [candidate division WOR-3 bacterium]
AYRPLNNEAATAIAKSFFIIPPFSLWHYTNYLSFVKGFVILPIRSFDNGNDRTKRPPKS